MKETIIASLNKEAQMESSNSNPMMVNEHDLRLDIPSPVHKHAFHEIVVLAFLHDNGRTGNWGDVNGHVPHRNKFISMTSTALLGAVHQSKVPKLNQKR